MRYGLRGTVRHTSTCRTARSGSHKVHSAAPATNATATRRPVEAAVVKADAPCPRSPSSTEKKTVPSTEAPGGIGELGTPGVAPALINAIHAATGKRLRTLPIGQTDLRRV